MNKDQTRLRDSVLPLLLVLACIYGCKVDTSADRAPTNDSKPIGQTVVDHAIEAMGGSKLDSVMISFKFRDRDYVFLRNGGNFSYQRTFHDPESGDTLVDVLTNTGLTRTINGQVQDLKPDRAQAFSNSINSVMYFAFLPYWLNDEAVMKNYRGKLETDTVSYHVVHISFREEKGGVDHDDNFLYWFDSKDHSLDFLAYDYVVNGGGVRFREAYNKRVIGGITFQDFINYKADSKSVVLGQMMSHFSQQQLQEMSRIELENIHVSHTKSK